MKNLCVAVLAVLLAWPLVQGLAEEASEPNLGLTGETGVAGATGTTGGSAGVGARDLSLLRQFTDPLAGYSIKIPAGYERLSEEENREMARGLSNIFAKKISEHAQRQPPTYFKGPSDPKRPNAAPPVFVISYYDSNQSIDPQDLPRYKDSIEEAYKKEDLRYGDLRLAVTPVNGINALRVENDIISPMNNSRGKIVIVRIPAPCNERHYEIFFNFSPNQTEEAQAALDTLLQTFKAEPLPVLDPASQSKWTRIILWTVGSGIAGVLFYGLVFLLSRRAGKKA